MRLRGKRSPPAPLPPPDPVAEAVRGAFESFPEPFLVVEPDSYRVLAANAKAKDGAPPSATTCHEMLWGSAEPCQDESHPCPVAHVMATWIPMRSERAVTRSDGTTRVFDVHAFPIKHGAGDVRAIGVLAADITNRKRDEHSAVSDERFRAVGELAGAAAHRFNNLLQVVVSGVQMALADLEAGDPAQVRDALQDILAGVSQGQNTVMGLLDVSRTGDHATSAGAEPCDLSVLVGQAIGVLSPRWSEEGAPRPSGTGLDASLTSGCVVRAKKRDVLELATGLIRHAMRTAPEGSSVQVSTGSHDGAVVMSVSHPGEPGDEPLKGSSVRMESGRWVPTELAAAHIIAERLGGSLATQSADREGVSYVVRLPAAVAPAPGDGIGEDGEPLSLLLVDDNPEVLASLEDGLRRAGHMVVTAPSGRAALQILKNRQVDAVVCDFLMPELDGLDVGREIARICQEGGTPKPPFVLLTGWLSDRERGRLEAARVDRLLQKPLEPARLLEAIRRLIADRR